MGQRIARAKRTIRDSGLPFRMPDRDERPARLRSVLHVLYLIFNEGYAASSGERLQRVDLEDEAIRLTRMLDAQLPGDPEIQGLLALMLLLDARRPARTDERGELVPLAEQDRSRWDRTRVAEGTALLDRAIGGGRVGEYQLQAAIAALHDGAPTAADTDWAQIEALYGILERMTGNPIVTVNRAVAAAMVHGPAAGLAILDGLGDALPAHHRVDAVRAHLLEQAGDVEGAIASYNAAARTTTSLPEQRYLTMRVARLRSSSGSHHMFLYSMCEYTTSRDAAYAVRRTQPRSHIPCAHSSFPSSATPATSAIAPPRRPGPDSSWSVSMRPASMRWTRSFAAGTSRTTWSTASR